MCSLSVNDNYVVDEIYNFEKAHVPVANEYANGFLDACTNHYLLNGSQYTGIVRVCGFEHFDFFSFIYSGYRPICTIQNQHINDFLFGVASDSDGSSNTIGIQTIATL